MDEDDEEPPSKHMKKDPSIEEDLVEGGMRENGSLQIEPLEMRIMKMQ